MHTYEQLTYKRFGRKASRHEKVKYSSYDPSWSQGKRSSFALPPLSRQLTAPGFLDMASECIAGLHLFPSPSIKLYRLITEISVREQLLQGRYTESIKKARTQNRSIIDQRAIELNK